LRTNDARISRPHHWIRFRELDFPRVDLIKTDVEEMELKLLTGLHRPTIGLSRFDSESDPVLYANRLWIAGKAARPILESILTGNRQPAQPVQLLL
jgi:hypothetical protein